MDKQEIAEVFEDIAQLLELKGENPFRIRAYRNAARSLLNARASLDELIERNELKLLDGIGNDLAKKIVQLALKNRLTFYERLKKSTPKGLLRLIQIHGLGPKKAKMLYQKLHIQSMKELKKACLAGKVAKIKGFGTKTEQNLLDSILHHEEYQKRYLWWDAMIAAEKILNSLQRAPRVSRAEIAGSLRRKLETVGDLDLLAASSNPKALMKWFTSQPFIQKVLAFGETKASVKLKGGMQADLRVVPKSQFGFALCYFTGSKEHNIKIRNLFLKKGWSLSEYGFEIKKQNSSPLPIKGSEETDVYHALNLAYIPPELRENLGEIEAAEKKNPSYIS